MMVRKPHELSEEDKALLKIELRAGCRNIGRSSIYSPPGQRVSMHKRESFGLCHDCGNFAFSCTQYRVKLAACERFENFLIPLNEGDPVVECSNYYTRGEEDAHDYSKNAWLLDPRERKVGMI